MAGGRVRKFASFLVILALVTAGVSPACKFISGKTPLLTVHAAHAAHAHHRHHGTGGENERAGHGGHQAAGSCDFCVAAHVNKAVADPGMDIALPAPARRAVSVVAAEDVDHARFTGPFRSRAPPFPA